MECFLCKWLCSDLYEKIDTLQEQLKQMSDTIVQIKGLSDSVPKPVIVNTVDRDECYRIIRNQFPQAKQARLYLWLDEYKIPTLESVKTYLNVDKTDIFPYLKDEYICVNFAFHLYGMVNIPSWAGVAFWVGIGNGHAFNIFLAGKPPKLYVAEPQTDKIYTMENLPKMYYPLGYVVG